MLWEDWEDDEWFDEYLGESEQEDLTNIENTLLLDCVDCF